MPQKITLPKPIMYFREESEREIELKSGPTSIHVSSISNEDFHKTKHIDENYPPEVVEALRAEVMALKQWKSRATQQIVERDRALADLESELVKQQSECDANNQECMGHQRVIQELKSQLDQVCNLQ